MSKAEQIEKLINEIERLDYVIIFDEYECAVAFDEAVTIEQIENVLVLMKQIKELGTIL